MAVSSDGSPIKGARITCVLLEGKLREPEGVVPFTRGHISITVVHPIADKPVFSGSQATDDEGKAFIKLSLPKKYLDSYIDLRVEADGFVGRGNEYQMELPHPNERKEITFRLQRGQPIIGRIMGLQEEDRKLLWIKVGEEDDHSSKTQSNRWYDLPKADEDGVFQSKLAPLVPLRLLIEHFHKKFKPYAIDLVPPFPRRLEITLEPNAEHVARGRVVFKITNPPADGKISYRLAAYSQSRQQMIPLNHTGTDASPSKADFREPGSYDVFLIALDGQPFWAHATFVVVMSGETEVPLTLEKTGNLRVRIRERSTGNPPASGKLWFELEYQIGESLHKIADLNVPDLEQKVRKSGEVDFPSIPSARISLVVKDITRKAYKPWRADFSVGSGETVPADVLLEPAKDEGN